MPPLHRLPSPWDYPDLPITAHAGDIIAAIASHRVLIVSGETGSGKTTQLPRYCLAAGRGMTGKIGCTQPRRIAAVTVAQRIAEEMGESIGQTVGYKIRFSDRIGRSSRIKIMTDGILLAETLSDPLLKQYDTLIVDEAHERSLNIDFILGYLRRLLEKRPDLKLIITSATMDTSRFSEAFGNAPIIEVSGRMYPVDLRYRPPASAVDGEDASESTYVEQAVDAVMELQAEGPFGDILVFMPTEQDIRETCELIEARQLRSTVVLPLFARLSAADQKRVFYPAVGRKIIVATNIAETSLTIPGIRYVIDTGVARISLYSPRSRTTSLMVRPISRSSADQRTGRCGRTENGICIRLYTEEDYLNRPLYTKPEILRANLAEVILRMLALKLGDIPRFPFIDPPDAKSISDGYDLLLELGAILPRKRKAPGIPGSSGKWSLTEDGRTMARIPLDPRLSRMLLHARKEKCLPQILILASALSISDPRDRPSEKAAEADAIHRSFMDPLSDFSSLLQIWKRYHETLDTEKTAGRMKRFCRQNYLSYRRMREWRDIHTQLQEILKETGFITKIGEETPVEAAAKADGPAEFSPLYRAVHRSILSGFLSNIAFQKEKNIYRAARDREVMLFPGSTLFNRGGPWIVAAEMVETSRVFARIAARIDNRWIEELGKNLCRYSWLHPHWERSRGEVVALEQVSLFGLTIITGRPVSYGRIRPEEARDIFIRSALIDGDVRQKFPFMMENARLMDEIRDIENRLRKRDLLVSEADIEMFYRERLQGVYDIRTLQRMIREAGNDDFLKMDRSSLMNYEPDDDLRRLFPDSIQLGDTTLECRYEFDPGCSRDGLTIPISFTDTPRIPTDSIDWMVPGFFRAKVEALIKSLPKSYRKQLLPISKTVEVIVSELPHQPGSLFTALSRFVLQRFGVDIPASEWTEEALPDYLKTRIEITGPDGNILASGRDAAIIHQAVSPALDPGILRSIREKYEKTDLTEWNFGDLAEAVEIGGHHRTRGILFPGLSRRPEKDGTPVVDLRLFEDRNEAETSHADAVVLLYQRAYPREFSFLKRSLSLPRNLFPSHFSSLLRQWEHRLVEAAAYRLFHQNIRSRSEFIRHAEKSFPHLVSTGVGLREITVKILTAWREVQETIAGSERNLPENPATRGFVSALRSQIDSLLPEGFLGRFPMEKLEQIPRYLRAVGMRAIRGPLDPEKDAVRQKEIREYMDRLAKWEHQGERRVSMEKEEAMENFFWAVQEYSVSLFAQELGTAFPVSRKRLDRMAAEIDRMV